jgi:diguanylate cyclase (GGDEF)-like protein
MNHNPDPTPPRESRVLLASLDLRLASDLTNRLSGISIQLAATPDAASHPLRPIDLLILDDGFVADTVAFLSDLRLNLPDLAVIYCLDPAADAQLVRRLLLDLKVRELLFHPVDREMLARRAASVLGLPHPGPPERASEPVEDALFRKLDDTWRRTRSRMLLRLEVLDRAGAAWVEHRLDAGLRQQAASEAHKLAGSLGTFGSWAGSRLAFELERALEVEGGNDESQAHRFFEVASALRLEVERSPRLQPRGANSACRGELQPALLVSPDSELTSALAERAIAWGWDWQAVRDVAQARDTLAELNPAAVLIDVDDGTAAMLDFLSELAARTPPVTAVILTSSGTLTDRLEVARRGGRGFFPKSLPPAEIVDAARALLDRQQSCAQVLAVDDDPEILNALGVLLGPHGIRLTSLSDPLALWDKLEGAPPDIILLDVEMPQVSGIELCRVVRNDLRWAAIPVVFLTAFSDPDTVRRVFASGADDFVSKPIVGPELVARIKNRLERSRLLRGIAEGDALTGLPNRVKGRQGLEGFLRLADRHGQPMGVALLGVDGLERVNEVHGPATGDEVLRELGRRLREEFRSEEVTARWRGNEFAVGLYGLDCQVSLRRLREFLCGFENARFTAEARSRGASEVTVTLSGGVAGYPEDGSDLEALLLAAGEARRHAMAAGGNQVRAATVERGGPRVVDLALVTGDEAAISLLVNSQEPEGYRTRALRSGLSAARALCGPGRSLQARVLLIDADLPGLDSLGFIKQLESEGILRETAVIVLSSASLGTDATQILKTGAADVIPKPVDLPVLADRVRRELRS